MAGFDLSGFNPSEVRHAEVDGAAIAWRELGSGDPLLMVAGWTGTMAEWDPALVALLARDRRVIVYDHRGAGESTGDVSQLTQELMAGDAAGLIGVLGLERTDVLAWSMGGNVALELALHAPELVGRMVLAASDAGGPEVEAPTDPEALRMSTHGLQPDTQQMMKMIYPPGHEADSQAYLERLAAWPQPGEHSFDVPAEVVEAQSRASNELWVGAGRGVADRLREIRTPAMIAQGSEDVLCPPANARYLAERIQGSKLVIYPGAGHGFLFQLHERVAADVDEFLSAR